MGAAVSASAAGGSDAAAAGGGGSDGEAASASAKALAAARMENDALRLQVLEMSQALGVPPPGANSDAPDNVGAGLVNNNTSAPSSSAAPATAGPSSSSSSSAAAAAAAAPTGPVKAGAAADKAGPKTALEAVDDNYFGSYSYFDIHRTMLDDVARTGTYRAALETNPSLVGQCKLNRCIPCLNLKAPAVKCLTL